MDRAKFSYELPAELIAQKPLAQRSASRLLELDGKSGTVSHGQIADLPSLLRPGDLLVFNDTRVLPARLAGTKATGGRVELLLERVTATRIGWFQIRASKSPRPGADLEIEGGARGRVLSRDGGLFEVQFDHDLIPYLKQYGAIPLPPYIDRKPDSADLERYQTIFGQIEGAVAAPTAGLHFDAALMARLAEAGVADAFLTLHVGAGTFAPVRTDKIEDHQLHAERVSVSRTLCDRIEQTKQSGGRVIAVGTTVVRALEAAAAQSVLSPFEGETSIFIYPGFRFGVVDGIVTNFHLPESSLLMLVSAFAGTSHTLAAYRQAVERSYRFFSYGDAMLVWPAGPEL